MRGGARELEPSVLPAHSTCALQAPGQRTSGPLNLARRNPNRPLPTPSPVRQLLLISTTTLFYTVFSLATLLPFTPDFGSCVYFLSFLLLLALQGAKCAIVLLFLCPTGDVAFPLSSSLPSSPLVSPLPQPSTSPAALEDGTPVLRTMPAHHPCTHAHPHLAWRTSKSRCD